MSEPQSEIYEFDQFCVDVGKRLLRKGDGEQIPLTPKVFDTLLFLLRNSGRLISKDELLREIWADSVVEENNLNQNISILRRAFGERPGEQRFIVTIAGRGYRFVPEVRPLLNSGIEDAKTDEPASARETEGIDSQTTGAELKATEYKEKRGGETRRRGWIVTISIFLACALSGVAFFVWRDWEDAVDEPIKSVAVLPFKPLVVEDRNEVLGLGMADTLISRLSGSEIVVRPLSAVHRYNSLDNDAQTAGRVLGVESILDGTIQSWGDRIRISAKLIRTSDGRQLWAGQFDEKYSDIFVVQDSISEKVAAALRIRVGNPAKKHATDNVVAYELYTKGRYHLSKLTPANIRASIPYFQQAIAIEPKYSLAYAGLAQANGVLGVSGDVPASEVFPKAKEAQEKAIEIDGTLAAAHTARCMASFWYDWDWSAAERHCRRALELDPTNAESHQAFAALLSNMGRHAEALAEVKLARELNPVDLVTGALEGQYLLFAGRPDEALVQLQKTTQLEPTFWMPHMFAASAYIDKGMFREAIAESQMERQLSGGNVLPFGTYALAKSGERDQALKALHELLKLSTTRYVPPYNIALVYHALEMRDQTLDWLEKGYEQRDPKMTALKVEPKWNNLRSNLRFVDLMKRMNLHE